MFFRQEIVFGPIHSRRLGSSLGINLLPAKGKLCNFDCIYCECGWNKDGKDDRSLPLPDDLSTALEKKLSECLRDGVEIDSITFAGDGEPTLNPHFPEMVDIALALRDKYYPAASVSVLSNATRVGKKEIFDALTKVDRPIMKIDAPSSELVKRINRPVGKYSLEDVVESLKAFGGRFVLQTMFLKSEDFDSSSPEVLEGWKKIVRELKPMEIMVYTVDRQTPQEGLVKFSAARMEECVKDLIEEGYKINIKG